MTRSTHAGKCCLLVAALILSACSTPTDPTRFYSLQTSAGLPATPSSNTNMESISLGLTAIRIPALIDRPQIVSRLGAHEIIRADYHQWGGSVLEEIEDTIVAELGKNLADSSVVVYPTQTRFQTNYDIVIDIRRFDGEIGKSVTLEMDWQISSATKQQSPTNGRISMERRVEAGDYSSYVADLKDLLTDASQQISTEIKKRLVGK